MIRKFLGHVMPGIIRPLRVLWNEIIGFIFLVLAIWAIPSAVRNMRDKGYAPSVGRTARLLDEPCLQEGKLPGVCAIGIG